MHLAIDLVGGDTWYCQRASIRQRVRGQCTAVSACQSVTRMRDTDRQVKPDTPQTRTAGPQPTTPAAAWHMQHEQYSTLRFNTRLGRHSITVNCQSIQRDTASPSTVTRLSSATLHHRPLSLVYPRRAYRMRRIAAGPWISAAGCDSGTLPVTTYGGRGMEAGTCSEADTARFSTAGRVGPAALPAADRANRAANLMSWPHTRRQCTPRDASR